MHLVDTMQITSIGAQFEIGFKATADTKLEVKMAEYQRGQVPFIAIAFLDREQKRKKKEEGREPLSLGHLDRTRLDNIKDLLYDQNKIFSGGTKQSRAGKIGPHCMLVQLIIRTQDSHNVTLSARGASNITNRNTRSQPYDKQKKNKSI